MTNLAEFKAEILLPAEIRMKEFGLDVKRVKKECSFAVQIVNKNKMLLECTHDSIMASVVNIAHVNLTLNPLAKEAYLIPRWNKKLNANECNLEPSYIGLVKLITDAGSVTSIQTNLVYDNEEFSIINSLNGTDFRHSVISKGDRGKIVGAYSVATHKTGEKTFEYMNQEEVEKIRDFSESWRAFKDPEKKHVTSCIWNTHEGEMYRKTCIKRLQKYLPRTKQMQYVDQAVKLSNSDWEATSGQVLMAENMINSSTLIQTTKEQMLRELPTSRSYEIEMIIDYLKDHQPNKIESGNNYGQGDIVTAVGERTDRDPDPK